MRALSTSEARVIHALLVAADVSERRREGWSGTPRATFLAVRKRAFAHGWLQSRYVPDPRSLGFDRVRFVLDQPFSDRLEASVRAHRDRPGTVLLWSSPETILSVTFEHSASAPGPSDDPIPPSRHRVEVVATDLPRHVPVYFDFEGAWSLWASGLSLVAYPVGLAMAGAAGPPAGPAGRHALEELLENAEAPPPEPAGPLRLSESYLPRSQRRVLERGAVRRRAFPSLAELPALPDGATLTSYVFVHGRLRRGATPDRLVAAVVGEARSRPFLVARDDRTALLGLLAPRPTRLREAGRPLIEVLSELLEEIAVVREPIATCSALIDHRYSRAIASANGG